MPGCCLRMCLNLSDHRPNTSHLWCIIVSLPAFDHVAIFGVQVKLTRFACGAAVSMMAGKFLMVCAHEGLGHHRKPSATNQETEIRRQAFRRDLTFCCLSLSPL